MLLYGSDVAAPRGRGRPSGARESQLFGGGVISKIFSKIQKNVTTTTLAYYIIRTTLFECCVNSFGAFAPINCTVANYFLGTMLLFTTETTAGSILLPSRGARGAPRTGGRGAGAAPHHETRADTRTYFVCMKSSRRATFAGITETVVALFNRHYWESPTVI